MELCKLIEIQRRFDSQHSSLFEWSEKISADNIEVLERLLVSLVGEFGELANSVKKVRRGDIELSCAKESIGEELADIFIYLLKLSYQLDIDIESEFLKKVKKNEQRFAKYQK